MPKILIQLIVIILLLQLTGCSAYDTTAYTVGPSDYKPLFPDAECMAIRNESTSTVIPFIAARQVPMGKVVISERLKTAWQDYGDDQLFVVVVCYAAMQPKHTPLPGNNDGQTLTGAAARAAECIESQGIKVNWVYNQWDMLEIYATKGQIKELKCDRDVALYICGGG